MRRNQLIGESSVGRMKVLIKQRRNVTRCVNMNSAP